MTTLQNILVGGAIIAVLALLTIWGLYGERIKNLFRKSGQQPNRSPVNNLIKFNKINKALAAPFAAPPPPQRIEPSFESALDQQNFDFEYTPPPLPPLEEHWRASYCYVVNFYEEQPQPMERFYDLLRQLKTRDIKVYCLLEFAENVQQWQPTEPGRSRRYWALLLPLADRQRALNRARLRLVQEECLRFAQRHQLKTVPAPLEDAEQRANALDTLCDQLDVVLNLRVLIKTPLSVKEMEELLAEIQMAKDGERFVYRLQSEVLFSAHIVLLPDNSAKEIAFNLDVPRVSQPQRAYEDMLSRMQQIAELKQGALYDRRHVQQQEEDIRRMRGSIETLTAKMTENNLPPGTPLATLLFS